MRTTEKKKKHPPANVFKNPATSFIRSIDQSSFVNSWTRRLECVSLLVPQWQKRKKIHKDHFKIRNQSMMRARRVPPHSCLTQFATREPVDISSLLRTIRTFEKFQFKNIFTKQPP